jgi:hypothetical protein
MSKEFFEPRTEKFNENNRERIIDKLNEFKEVINILKEIENKNQSEELTLAKNKKNFLDRMDLKVFSKKLDSFIIKVQGIKPEMFGDGNHFAHIIGQLNTEMGFVVRLKKHLKNRDYEKAANCCLLINQAFESLGEYMDLCFKYKEFLFSEIFSDDGYWGKQTILLDKKRIEQMNAHEFIIASRDELEEKFENK